MALESWSSGSFVEAKTGIIVIGCYRKRLSIYYLSIIYLHHVLFIIYFIIHYCIPQYQFLDKCCCGQKTESMRLTSLQNSRLLSPQVLELTAYHLLPISPILPNFSALKQQAL